MTQLRTSHTGREGGGDVNSGVQRCDEVGLGSFRRGGRTVVIGILSLEDKGCSCIVRTRARMVRWSGTDLGIGPVDSEAGQGLVQNVTRAWAEGERGGHRADARLIARRKVIQHPFLATHLGKPQMHADRRLGRRARAPGPGCPAEHRGGRSERPQPPPAAPRERPGSYQSWLLVGYRTKICA